MSDEKYDVIFYTPEHSQTAKALVRHMSEDEAKERSISGLVPARRIISVAIKCRIPNLQPGNSKAKLFGKAIWAGRFGAVALDLHKPERHLDMKEIEPGLVVGNYKPGVFDSDEFIKHAEADRKILAASRKNKLDIQQYDDSAKTLTLASVIEREAKKLALMLGVKEKKLDKEMIKDITQRIFLRAQSGDSTALVIMEAWLALNELPKETTPDEILDDYELRAGMAYSTQNMHGIWSDYAWANSQVKSAHSVQASPA